MDEHREQRLSRLMARAQDGDRQAYKALLQETAQLVRQFARRRLPERADDVVQETLIALHRARHTYDPERPFGPWMYAIARNRVADAIRREQRRVRRELRAEVSQETDVTFGDRAFNARILRRALSQLSESQRKIIELLKFEDYSVAEVAAQTGLSESAIKVSAHRGYRRLRALLGGSVDE